jgi:hypothetical protein
VEGSVTFRTQLAVSYFDSPLDMAFSSRLKRRSHPGKRLTQKIRAHATFFIQATHQRQDVIDGETHPESPVAAESHRGKHVVAPQLPHARTELRQPTVEECKAVHDLHTHSDNI